MKQAEEKRKADERQRAEELRGQMEELRLREEEVRGPRGGCVRGDGCDGFIEILC